MIRPPATLRRIIILCELVVILIVNLAFVGTLQLVMDAALAVVCVGTFLWFRSGNGQTSDPASRT